uniref:Putative ezrin-radixin-moesin-binding phosphoprotein 50 n=1 Tax=Anopheles marajoara TaxID=58244 RepID=A0A2M4BVP4_9DIPT
MSSKTNGTTPAVANGTPKYEARLCHVVKRADFDGYGFNLHAEKGRPGQYIGKVDDGSPAEGAGLRQGDRIIEVNGHNITTETHKKVVELIKAVPNETRLLVIDPRADANDLKMALAKASTAATTPAANNNNSSTTTNGTSNGHQENGGGKLHSNENGQKKDSIKGEEAEEKSPKSNGTVTGSTNNNITTTNNNINSQHHQNGNGTAMDKIIDDTKKVLTVTYGAATGKMALNGAATEPSAAAATATATTPAPAPVSEGKKLNLPLTAAEMRAQLAARKKYDPKNDVCDLRKKYEIIQKM